MGKILIKNGRVIDPANIRDEVLDILIENSKIAKIEKNILVSSDKTIDADGKIVMPGIVDMHVHLREPGREDKETIATGTQAALKGGVTSLLAMPNTEPAIDSEENISLLKNMIKETALANVFIAGSITKGRLGRELSQIAALKQSGALAITDDGASVDDEALMRAALIEAKKNNLLVICHCEDKKLSAGGVVNRGFTATRMGLRGISNESEYKRVERDLRLAEETGAPIHIAHVSCKESVELIAKAKKKGIKVTAETAPHYFALSEDDVINFDTNMKINPPLRAKEDLLAIREGLKSGVIDVIASDHAPHTENEKDIEFERAEFGVTGLETLLSVSISELIDKGVLDWSSLVEKLTIQPAKILGIDKETLKIGAEAEMIVVDPQREWLVEKRSFLSKSKNSAFLGRRLKGVVDFTICRGKIVYQEE